MQVTIDTQHEPGCKREGSPCCRHPQTVAACSDADVLIYGGAAGSGKSFFLCYDGAKHVHVPSYAGVFFRRTAPELQGAMSLWEETQKLYPLLGGVSRESPVLEWRFPVGSLLQAMHLQHAKNVSQHQSKRYAWIGFDELTTFDESQFWFLLGRAGSMSGVKPRIRGTCNPDPDSFVAKLISWWIDKDGYPIPERSGVKRWFWRMPDGSLRWADSAEELLPCVPTTHPSGEPRAREERLRAIMSLTFVSAKLSDNALFEKADPSYRAKLEALPPVLRARMLGGNWRVRESSGDYFQRSWFPRVGQTSLERSLAGQPTTLEYVRHVRCWDLAGTPMRDDLVPGIARPEGFMARTSGNPDWTRGLFASLVRHKGQHSGKIVLRDLKSWRDTPGAVRSGIIRTAKADPPGTVVVLFHDPAQAGIDQIEMYRDQLKRAGIGNVLVLEVNKSKLEYAGPASRLAYSGGIWVDDPDDTWSVGFFNEIEQFPPPPGSPRGEVKQDCTDVLSGVVRALERLGSGRFAEDQARGGVSAEQRFMFGEDEDAQPEGRGKFGGV